MANQAVTYGQPKILVQELKGLNERERFNLSDLGEFDFLKNLIPTDKNSLTKVPGSKLYLHLPGKVILKLCQTNDSRKNVIIQTTNEVYVISENELFSISTSTNLTPIPQTEIMAVAIILHKENAATSGGSSTTSFAQRPLTHIVSQLNADGSAASFVTLAANQITIAAGVYIINGWAIGSHTTVGKKCVAQLYNVTAAAAAWAGAANEASPPVAVAVSGDNVPCPITGTLNLASPTIFEIRQKCDTAQATSGFGLAYNQGVPEVYAALEIYKLS